MKVWITKYALTKEIIETEIDNETIGTVYFKNNMHFDSNAVGKYWHTTREGAILRAEEMRQKKIESLKAKIKKLEEMRFE